MNTDSVCRFLTLVSCACALVLASACGDDGDAGGGGGDGDGDSDAAVNMDAATVDGSGDGDGDGDGDGPVDTRTTTEEEQAGVCEFLIGCDLIPGPELTMDRCMTDVTDDCVTCTLAAGDVDAGTDTGDAGMNCDGMGNQTEAEAIACSGNCGMLLLPPTNVEECLDITAAGDSTPEYNACLCDNCMDQFAMCIADPLCWAIVQCAVRTGCDGMACYFGECMGVIDEAGATSLSTAMSSELGTCTTNNCAGL